MIMHSVIHHHHILLPSQKANNRYSAINIYRKASAHQAAWPPIITFICIVNIQTFIPTFRQTQIHTNTLYNNNTNK